MKKTVLRNAVLLLSMLLLSFPYNYLVRLFSFRLSVYSYITVVVYAVCCGVLFSLLDLSDKRINWAIFAVFVLVLFADIQYPLFSFGPTLYLYFLMAGALLPSLFKKTADHCNAARDCSQHRTN